MRIFGTIGKQQSSSLLQSATELYWNMEKNVPISKGQWGKPYFNTMPYRQFNLSHSGNITICALDCSPVGIDVQKLRSTRTKFLDQICSAEERQWLLGFKDSQTAFALFWALKESQCKYTGRGITRPISQIEIPLPKALPLSEQWETMMLNGLFFSICTCQNGMISVCGECAPTHPIQWID